MDENTEEIVTSAEKLGNQLFGEENNVKKDENIEEKDSSEGILEKKAESSEDPIEDEVAQDKEDKSTDDSKPEENSENSDKTEYTLEVSENSLLGEKSLADVKTFAEANKLTNEAAQELLSREEQLVGDFHQGQLDDHATRVEGWADEVEGDALLGGNNMEATTVNARAAVKRFGGDEGEFAALLRDSGYGNNPTVVRFLNEIGKAMKSDSAVKGDKNFGDTKSERPIHDLFYDDKN